MAAMKIGVAIVVAAGLTACAASDTGTGPDPAAAIQEETEQACVPGQQSACACPNGGAGVQLCRDDGSGYAACDCPEQQPEEEEEEEPSPCGNALCEPGESCHTCEADCGTCEPCNIAPSCDNAMVPPATLAHVGDFDVPKMEALDDAALEARLVAWVAEGGPAVRVLAAALAEPRWDEHPFVSELRAIFAASPRASAKLRASLGRAGMEDPAGYRAAHPDPSVAPESFEALDVEYPGGTVDCGAPLLRLGIHKIVVHEEDDDFANDIVYCVAQAETMEGAEIRVTPQTPNLDEGDEYSFSLEAGVFWGQQEPRTPGGDMLITYDCIEADTSDGYQQLINAIGQAAGEISNVVDGDNGWIFTTAAAIAPVVSTGLSLDSDDHLFNAQQTIPLDRQLELTNGGYWTVRREGTHNLSDWDWELFVRAWGCAEYGLL